MPSPGAESGGAGCGPERVRRAGHEGLTACRPINRSAVPRTSRSCCAWSPRTRSATARNYWAAFDAGVAPHLPGSPGVIDLGFGPPLFLRDLARRYPSTPLYGYDITLAMIADGQRHMVGPWDLDQNPAADGASCRY